MAYEFSNFWDVISQYTYGEDPRKDNAILTSIVLDMMRYNTRDGHDGLMELDKIRHIKREIRTSIENPRR